MWEEGPDTGKGGAKALCVRKGSVCSQGIRDQPGCRE